MVTQIDMKDKVFYQDFLMEIPTTNDEFPDVELQYVESLEGFKMSRNIYLIWHQNVIK